jgi:hypothetical protein
LLQLNTTFTNMANIETTGLDLITAKVNAATLSKTNSGKIVYINVDGEGDCNLDFKKKGETTHAFKNGSEIKLEIAEETTVEVPETKPAKEVKAAATPKADKKEKPAAKEKAPKKSETKKAKTMATVEKKKAVKTTAKKAPVKREVAPGKSKIAKAQKGNEKAAWKTRGDGETPRGCNMYLSAAEWKKVDVILEKEGVSFNAWAKSLIRAKIK